VSLRFLESLRTYRDSCGFNGNKASLLVFQLSVKTVEPTPGTDRVSCVPETKMVMGVFAPQSNPPVDVMIPVALMFLDET
jgi:hypothetical protein